MQNSTPTPVRAAIGVWLAAVAAGVLETVLHLTAPDAPGLGAVLVRAGIYVLVVVLVLALRSGRNSVRWALTVLLGGLGTVSLVVEPISWLIAGGSPVEFLASADITTLGVVVLRTAHLVAVVAAVVLMFRPRSDAFFREHREEVPAAGQVARS